MSEVRKVDLRSATNASWVTGSRSPSTKQLQTQERAETLFHGRLPSIGS